MHPGRSAAVVRRRVKVKDTGAETGARTQAQEQKGEREAAERGYRHDTIGDFMLAKPTVMLANGQDYDVPAGRHAVVGEISIVDAELRTRVWPARRKTTLHPWFRSSSSAISSGPTARVRLRFHRPISA
jgi:hypothetical protein